MANTKAVTTALRMLGRVFAGDITTEKTEMYVAALEDLSDEQIAASVAILVRTHEGQFLPVPAQIRAAVNADAKPAINVERLIRQIDKTGSYNPNSGWCPARVEIVRERFGDAVADAYGQVGGGARLFSSDETGRIIAARDFENALRAAVESGVTLLLENKPVGYLAGS